MIPGLFIMNLNVKGHKLTKEFLDMRSDTENVWRSKIEKISNVYLKRKVSAIVFWDFANYMDYNTCIYLKKIMQKYLWKLEADKISEKKLAEGLIRIGYPEWYAKIRAKKPKDRYNKGESNESKRRYV